MSVLSRIDFAGEVSAETTFERLKSEGRAALVDVRTKPEWQFVGVPDLSEVSKSPVFVEWKSYPDMRTSSDFVLRVAESLREVGVDRDASVFFICRSGARSREAATAMAAAGWSHCFNVSDGFEGDLDESGRRGLRNGWRASGLPWKQT